MSYWQEVTWIVNSKRSLKHNEQQGKCLELGAVKGQDKECFLGAEPGAHHYAWLLYLHCPQSFLQKQVLLVETLRQGNDKLCLISLVY